MARLHKQLISLAIAALFTGVLGACGGPDDAASDALARAAEERAGEIADGDEADAGDILLILLGAANNGPTAAPAGSALAGITDPGRADTGNHIDEPLTPTVDDRRELVGTTSPDPAPEIDGNADSNGECKEGYTLYEGRCIPDSIARGLEALGETPDPAPEDGR